MTGTIDDATARSQSDQGKHKDTAETTPRGHNDIPWVEVAINLMPGEAVIIKSRLESEDIPVYLKQEAIGSVLGLTVGSLGSAKILVPESMAERAADILAETFDSDEVIEWEEEWDEEDDEDEEE